MEPKPIRWVGRSRDDVRAFPDAARRIIGKELFRAQLGFDPLDWKPMPAVAPGVKEIRIHADNEYRVLYIAHFAEAVYVLHAPSSRRRALLPGDTSNSRGVDSESSARREVNDEKNSGKRTFNREVHGQRL